MATESLAEVVLSLTPQEQDAVRHFIDYLKRRDASVRSPSPFLQAADEFIAQHPELLQRLSQ
jgi:predicted alpha/beta-hydrolase family hydrolase